MTIEERLKEYIVSRYDSVLAFTNSIDMPYGTINSIFKRGINNSSIQNIIKICKALDISADELADGRITPNNKESTAFDWSKSAFLVRMSDELILDGQPLTEEEKETLGDFLEFAVEYLRRRRK